MHNRQPVVIALDLGGTWIKGAARPLDAPPATPVVTRWRNPLDTLHTGEAYAAFIAGLCRELAGGQPIQAVVAATAGEVDASGQRYRIAGAHLRAMATTPWLPIVQATLGCPCTLINDADAFVLGWAAAGKLSRDSAVGALVVGTGVGFSVVRLGRWWRPDRRTIFLGCAWTEQTTYDQWASAVQAAESAGGNLAEFLSAPAHATACADYLEGLTRVIASAAVLYHLNEVVLGGGLVDAAAAAGVDLHAKLSRRLKDLFPPVFATPRLTLATEGNRVTLEGTLAMAAGNAQAEAARYRESFRALGTEGAGVAIDLERLSADAIARHLAEAESRAAQDFIASVPALGRVAQRIADAVQAGGRVIYVGAGTSGRVGTLDAVEIPCTFGEDPGRFVAVVAGGLSDASLTIEGDGEEDISAVPDLLLLQPGPRDVVIGLSASGTAFFVRSALAYARARGSFTVLVHESAQAGSPFYDDAIALHSGPECIRGSTRMKAGTATKKALNILSTTAMIRLGKVRKGLMIDVVASNDKLRSRAEGILSELTGMNPEQARRVLVQNGYHLRTALDVATQQR